MATSGTYNFSVTRDQVITAALRKCGSYGLGDTIPPEEIDDAAFALNLMLKEMAINGLPLWCVQDIAIPMVAGQTSYNVSAASGTTLPLRILDAYIRDSTGNDTSLQITSRYDYDTLGQKTSQAVPNQIYYDPQLGAGAIVVYNVPANNSNTIHVVIQRQIQDINLATETFDFPQEAYRTLVWGLADEISLDQQCTADVRKEINAKAVAFKEKFFDSTQEQASIYFTPAERQRT